MTKLEVTIRADSESREHRLELVAGNNLTERDSGRLRLLIDGEAAEVDWAEITPGVFSVILGGRSYEAAVTRSGDADGPAVVTVGTRQYAIQVQDPRLRRHGSPGVGLEGPQEIRAPMPGRIVKVLVSENDQVGLGDGLVVIEAMKMQNELRAPRPGRVEKIYVAEGSGVEAGLRLLRLG